MHDLLQEAIEVYPDVPPRVEYSLTEFGAALREIVHELLEWAVRKPE